MEVSDVVIVFEYLPNKLRKKLKVVASKRLNRVVG